MIVAVNYSARTARGSDTRTKRSTECAMICSRKLLKRLAGKKSKGL